MLRSLWLFLAVAGLGNAAAASATLSLVVTPTGAFTIAHNGKPWLSGGETIVGSAKASDGSLVTTGAPVKGSGTDKLGPYISTTLSWAKKAGGANAPVAMMTSFRTYAADAGMIVFEQKFPAALAGDELLTGQKHDLSSASTVFPAFSRGGGADGADLDCFAYHGVFPGMKACKTSTYKESHQGGAPLTIYDSANATLPMTVFSPLNFPKAHHMASDTSKPSKWFGAGVKASVTAIPAGWSQLFVLSAGVGVNAGMMAWGGRMLKFTGKPRADMYRDETHSTIGFWTDNGGYYHYSTGTDKKVLYETALPEVKAYHDKIGVPFHHWQFDSWFYPKDGKVGPGGGGGAVTNWTNMPSVFPNKGGVNGMVEIQKLLTQKDGSEMPVVMHNRQWSIKSDYIKAGIPASGWYTSAKAAVPKDPIEFFTWFFKQQEGWGLSMYEQDWMCTEYDDVKELQTNITMGDLWLLGMATGVAASNRTQQYCMPYPNDLLSASAYAAVTNARATGDYFHAPHQWAVGGTSLFYWAIGILPFKDGFYSSTNKQVGGQTVGPEKDPDRECLMATLSCAMVGPMDGINLLNKTRTMTSCRADGYLLKPDKPVSTTDACFRRADPTCFTYHTYSDPKVKTALLATQAALLAAQAVLLATQAALLANHLLRS